RVGRSEHEHDGSHHPGVGSLGGAARRGDGRGLSGHRRRGGGGERGMTLVEFLMERIAEDEEIRRRILDRAGYAKVAVGGAVSYVDPHADRLLTECEAKRRIVNQARGWLDEGPDGTAADAVARDVYESVARRLALPYADHPDYNEAWRP